MTCTLAGISRKSGDITTCSYVISAFIINDKNHNAEIDEIHISIEDKLNEIKPAVYL